MVFTVTQWKYPQFAILWVDTGQHTLDIYNKGKKSATNILFLLSIGNRTIHNEWEFQKHHGGTVYMSPYIEYRVNNRHCHFAPEHIRYQKVNDNKNMILWLQNNWFDTSSIWRKSCGLTKARQRRLGFPPIYQTRFASADFLHFRYSVTLLLPLPLLLSSSFNHYHITAYCLTLPVHYPRSVAANSIATQLPCCFHDHQKFT